jgi:hypothetical protein
VPATTELLDAARRALLDGRRQLTLDELSDLGRAPQEDLVMLDNLRMPVGTLSKVI